VELVQKGDKVKVYSERVFVSVSPNFIDDLLRPNMAI